MDDASFDNVRVTAALQVVLGEPFANIGRAADMAWMGFGELVEVRSRRTGGARAVSEHALHVQCPFRLTRDQAVLVASGDMYYPRADPYLDESTLGEPFDWDALGANWFDGGAEAVHDLIRDLSPRVVAVTVDTFGGLNMTMTANIELVVFPNRSFPSEHWRFFRANGPHLVVMERPDDFE
jgi:hypothetical protein